MEEFYFSLEYNQIKKHITVRGVTNITQQIRLYSIRPKEGDEEFLKASSHRSFCPPKFISQILQSISTKQVTLHLWDIKEKLAIRVISRATPEAPQLPQTTLPSTPNHPTVTGGCRPKVDSGSEACIPAYPFFLSLAFFHRRRCSEGVPHVIWLNS
jgi:hypothetical protein